MTQPRKEQIDDIQAKFSLMDSRIASQTNPPNVLQPLGEAVSTLLTNAVSPAGYNPYTAFLDSTVTGEFGGALETSPGWLIGTNQEPFTLAASQQFTVTCPILNSGLPITVTLQTADVITIAGFPVVTASRLAARINTVVTPYYTAAGIAGSPEIASDVDGYVWLRTPTSGDDAMLTITDISAGMLNVFYAAGSSPSISVEGVSAPKRGVVTISPDGRGGKALLRKSDTSPALVRQHRRLHLGGMRSVPDFELNREVFARCTAVGGSSVKISLYNACLQRPSAITGTSSSTGTQSNLTSLGAGDTITITLDDPAIVTSTVVSANFTGITTSSSIQNIINIINLAWQTAGVAKYAGTDIPSPLVGGVSITKPAFLFGTSTFRLYLNSEVTAITVSLTSAVTTPALLATAINGAIIAAGQSAQGSAALVNDHVVISATSTSGIPSTVWIRAGVAPAQGVEDMTALNEMGISPGRYSGSTIAELYGNSEIRFVNPIRSSTSTLSITGSSPTLAKFGFASAVSVGSIYGEESINPHLSLSLIIPEAMEFGEVPDTHDEVFESFITPNGGGRVNPADGISNAGGFVALDEFGKLPPDLQSSIVATLNAHNIVALAQAGSPNSLAVGTVATQLLSLLVNTNFNQDTIADLISDLASAPGSSMIGYSGTGMWANGNTLASTNVRDALHEIVDSIGTTGGNPDSSGSSLVGFTPSYSLSSDNVQSTLDDIDYRHIKHVLSSHYPVATTATDQFVGVVHDGNQFIAVGSIGNIYTSPTGKVWTARTHGTSSNFNALATNGTSIVIVGDDISQSVDGGVNWIVRQAGVLHWSVTYANGQYMSVGPYTVTRVMTSPTGEIWTNRFPVGAASEGNYRGVTYGNGIFVIAGYDDYGAPVVETSADNGITWTERTIPDSDTELWCVHYFNGRYVTAGSKRKIFTSTDAITWTEVTNPVDFPQSSATDVIFSVTVIENVWVMATNKGEILTSKDGLSWDLLRRQHPNYIQKLAYDGKTIVMVGGATTATTSSPIRVSHMEEPAMTRFVEADSHATVFDVTLSPARLITRIIGLSYALPQNTATDNTWWFTGGNALQSTTAFAVIEYGISHELKQDDVFYNFKVDVSPGFDAGPGNRMTATLVRRNLTGSSTTLATVEAPAGTGNLTIDSGVITYNSNLIVDKDTYSYYIQVAKSATAGATDFSRSASITVTRSKLD